MSQGVQEWIKQNLLKTAFKNVKFTVNFFKGCFQQILLGSFLNILTHPIVLSQEKTLKISEDKIQIK